ncbi:glycoside hydrolase family 78 protein [Microbacterium sp. ZXX196]|uniref:glycoside hydrolase family 78 protein n=1 Tax=Microbacterium sp. ZXX196 TaxID=2609291 RepID=UPI0012B6EC94|nr:glycoside hydrolase family 78 protein [Microbacterium sp. ZXX196]MTE24900.1 Bacterial alpha-L-rhamnosidase [Microbacterium sp. ZXX196]
MTTEPHFISAPGPVDTTDPAPYFRREFVVQEGLVRATLSVTALGVVTSYLNAQQVGQDEVLVPGWTSYQHRLNVSTYDVSHLLSEGENAFGAIVGEGWAVGRLGWEGARQVYSERPALYAKLELDYGNRVETIASDESFTVGSGAVLVHSLYDGEHFDARLDPTGWNAPGFDDTAWSAAQPFEWNLDTLVEPVGPPIRRIEDLAPVVITQSASGAYIVDFGQNIAGWLRITVDGTPGSTIEIRHAELLNPAGELDVESNRTAAATDRYTLRGDGPESWEPSFTFHGFRYAEITGWPGELTADDIRAVVVHSDMQRTGWFETSNPLVTKLHENVVWSMRGNFVGLPTDCPQRDERLGWTGDINAFGPTAAYLYDVRGVLGSWLKDLAAEQFATGEVPWVVPGALPQWAGAVALWSDVAVSLPWTLYQEYGDLDILRDAYTSMTTYTRQVAGLLDERHLWSSGFQFGDWLDPDAPANNPMAAKTSRYFVATAFLCRVTREMAHTAELLGRLDDAAEFAALDDRVRSAFRREYVAESGRLVGESVTGYALAIAFDLLDDAQRLRAGERLAELVAERGYRISTGFAGTPLVTDALSGTGQLDAAYKLLLETECPSFLYPVTMGATTVWERWDAVLPDGTFNSTGMTSLNHYALGAVCDWLHRVVGGIQRVEPGYASVRIAPQPGGGLTSARTVHDTVRGQISVDWSIEDGRARVQVTIPEGVRASVVLPGHPEAEAIEVSPGEHEWEYEVPQGYGMPEPLSFQSSILDISRVPEVWEDVAQSFTQHFPGLPLDTGSPLATMPLNSLLEAIPGVSDEFRSDLKKAIAH